jgi:hypothetical protein
VSEPNGVNQDLIETRNGILNVAPPAISLNQYTLNGGPGIELKVGDLSDPPFISRASKVGYWRRQISLNATAAKR